MKTIPVAVNDLTPQPVTDLAFSPNEADKNIYLLLAHRKVLTTLMPAIKNLRNYHKQPNIKKAIDKVHLTNQAAFQALQEFYHQAFAGRIPESMKASAERIENLYLHCAMLPYATETDRIPDLEQHVENFHKKCYTIVDSDVVDAFVSANGDPSAGMMELVNRYFPDADPAYKQAFATGVEKLIGVRQQLGVHV